MGGRVTPRAQGTDEQLVAAARAGDEHAAGEVVRRFEWLAIGVASRYYMQGGDLNDLRQEARVGVVKAIRDFRPDSGAPFGAFVRVCIERQVITAVKTAARAKHRPLTFAVTGEVEVDDGELGDVLDLAVAPNTDAGELLADRERALLILRVISDGMSDLERDCIVGFANGESYVDTAQRLGLPVRPRGDQPTKSRSKTIDNALQRARLKIRLALAEADRIALGEAA